MKTLVVYTSKYGSTKQYAEWIASDVGADLREASAVQDADLEEYDAVVCGAYLHIGTYIGGDFLKQHWENLQDKKVVLFTVSGAGATSPEQKTWYEANIPADIRKHIQHFPLQGRAVNLDVIDRILVSFPRMMLTLQYWKNPTPENKKAIDTFRPFDGVKREYIVPIVDYIKNQTFP